MALIEGELGSTFAGRVRRKANKTGRLSAGGRPGRDKAAGAAAGSPEVMVKVSSYGSGGAHVAAHLAYTSRHGKVELEDERGHIHSGKDEIRSLIKDWKADFQDGRRRAGQRDTMNAVFSMPAGTPTEAVREAVRGFCKKEFGSKGHEFVFALHSPENDDKTQQPHCHVTVRCRGVDGRRLSTNAVDIQRWREGFAIAMRAQGVDCEATGRTARGRVLTSERQKYRHTAESLASRGVTTKAATVAQAEAKRDVDMERAGQQPPARPWERAIAMKQAVTRAAYATVATALEEQAMKREAFANRKEIVNDQPDYDRRISPVIARAVHLLQSGAARAREAIPAGALARVRELPGLDVVRDKNSPQVLLHEDARRGVGDGKRGRDADHGMRRPGAGLDGPAGRGARLTGTPAAPAADRALAASVRGFVAGMPSIATRHQVEKRRIAAEHARSQLQERDAGADKAPSSSPAATPPAPPKQDLER
jgi:type IV secretory pathway VirD2 relaxase